jgi:hypothetical protein
MTTIQTLFRFMSFAPTRQSKLSPSADASRGLANPNNRIPGATLLGLTSAIQGRSLRRHWRAALVVAFLLSGICGHAQTFAIDWFTISGGGGSCTGGAFTVSATIGQPAANQQELTGGNFSVLGGFWSLFAVQTPGAPLLSIALNPQFPAVTVSWPSPSTGFVLQQTADLTGTNWVAVSLPLNDNGTSKFVIVNPPGGNRFYRLFKP